jgi:hypothetical protein
MRYLQRLGRPLTIVVCGGRRYDDGARVWRALDGLHERFGIELLGHGASGSRRFGKVVGADLHAHDWAVEVGVEVEAFPARWDDHGRAAGPRRNRRMLEAMVPDLVVAFPGSRGTEDCVGAAKQRGIRVWGVR